MIFIGTLGLPRGGGAWRERVGEQAGDPDTGLCSPLFLLFTYSEPLPQSRHFSGCSANWVPLWPGGQGQLPLLLQSGAHGVCIERMPEQWGVEWDGAHLPS